MLDQNHPRLRFTLTSELLGPLQLQVDPLGWEDIGIQLHRDPKYHGLTTEYTVELGFVQEGKAYLSQLFALADIEAEAAVFIEVYDPNEFSWEPYYHGRISFAGSSETAEEFRCTVEKAGFTQRFLNREDSTVDLLASSSVGGVALPTPAPVTVPLHSRAIRQRYEARTPQDSPPPLPDYINDGESQFKSIYFGFGSPSIDEFGVQEVNTGTVTMPQGNDNPEVAIYTAKERGQFSIEFALEATLEIKRDAGDFDKAEGEIAFRINNEQVTQLMSWRDTGINGTYRKQLTAGHRVIRSLEVGDKLYLYGRLHVYDIHRHITRGFRFISTVQLQFGSFFKMSADSQTAPTPASGLLAYEALDRLAQALTDTPVALRSTFFGRTDTTPSYAADGPGSLLLVTGGFQVRGFPLALKSLYATWKELFDSLSAAYWLGYGLERLPSGEEIIRVENAAYFYARTVALELTTAVEDFLPDADNTAYSNFTRHVLEERYFIKTEIGYQKWQTQQTNGLDEFNTRREWSLPLTQVQASYSAVNNYITSGFYLESTRRQRYDATATTDDRADNDNFLICLLRDTLGGFQTERNQLFAEVAGVLSPDTVYNIRLSPARALRRHAPLLAAGLRAQTSQSLRFTFGEGNNAFRSRLPGEAAVLENADIPVSELGEPLWRNESYSFTAPCTWQQALAVLANPNGRIRFRNARREVCEGWILDFKHKLAQKTADFTLLRCATISIG